MTFLHATPVLGILNEVERPYPIAVVVVIGKPDKLRWAYVVPRDRGNADNDYQ
jgi:hypothetical protein